MSEQRPYPASDWLRGTGEMVWCPGCAFGFGAEAHPKLSSKI